MLDISLDVGVKGTFNDQVNLGKATRFGQFQGISLPGIRPGYYNHSY